MQNCCHIISGWHVTSHFYIRLLNTGSQWVFVCGIAWFHSGLTNGKCRNHFNVKKHTLIETGMVTRSYQTFDHYAINSPPHKTKTTQHKLALIITSIAIIISH